MATVTTTPASGSITAKVTAVRVTCATVPSNDTSEYDIEDVPTEPELNYYFRFRLAGFDDLVSPVWSTNVGGTAEWNDVILPGAGSWALTVRDASDDSQVATATITVA